MLNRSEMFNLKSNTVSKLKRVNENDYGNIVH